MGEAIDRLRAAGYGPENTVALAGTVRVESHKRTSKSGKVVDVEAYTRSLRNMNASELQSELKNAGTNRMKKQQITNEIRRRGSGDSSKKTPDLSNESEVIEIALEFDLFGRNYSDDRNYAQYSRAHKALNIPGSEAWNELGRAVAKLNSSDKAKVVRIVKNNEDASAKELIDRYDYGYYVGGAKDHEDFAKALESTGDPKKWMLENLTGKPDQDATKLRALAKQNPGKKETLTESVQAIQKGQGGTMGSVADGLAKMGLGKSDEAKSVRSKSEREAAIKKLPVSDPKTVDFVKMRGKKGTLPSDLAYEESIPVTSASRRLAQQVDAGVLVKKGQRYYPKGAK